jgi:tRNA G18 (ribose-2'-O)-methylase SpoU
VTTSQPYNLVGVDIQGEWNRPLLINAAALSGCSCVFASSGVVTGADSPIRDKSLESVIQPYRRILACETGKNRTSIYDFPAPRENTALLVGNEEEGLPRSVLKLADAVVAIPMARTELSSVNVAVAAAISLYALSRDLGRRKRPKCQLRLRDVDLLVEAPPDPHEIGSLLRSAYAFGWRRVFVSDPHRVWFTDDPRVVLEGRAAARRGKNLLAVRPADEIEPSDYEAILACDPTKQGEPLSRVQLPECRRLLLVLGGVGFPDGSEGRVLRVSVDFLDRKVTAHARHTGSVFLSVVASLLGG